MLKVVYSNDMVQLAAQLADIQQHDPLLPFEAETVIVQSNELARWLSLFIAQQHGIVSNIEFPYPSAYIWSLFRKMLSEIPKQSPYSTDVMTWQIFELLPECESQQGFEVIANYLGDQCDVLKRFTLAHRIADSFDQYLMYRPDWIQQWERGQEPHWQAKLWGMLTKGEQDPRHRANLLQQMHDLLADVQSKPDLLPSRLSIIGITALPPAYLSLFELMARFCDVTLYFLSPSEDYWGDLIGQKQQAKHLSLLGSGDAEYMSNGHPLLASLGKQGQAFYEQLQAHEHEAFSFYIPPQTDSLLGQLQFDMFSLRDIHVEQLKTNITETDNSIQVHACHSAMREVEVLHDQVLAMFEADPELSPTDIVVMTPDIELYASAIDAVFASASPEQSIPFSIADCGVRKQSQLINTFMALLDLPQSRFDVESILNLLETAAVQQQFSLDDNAVARVRTWIRDTHTCWGLSGEDKAKFDLPETVNNTWRAGLDRLLLGYAMGMTEHGETLKLFDNMLPFDGVRGEGASIMAQLCKFIDSLDRCKNWLQTSKTTLQWQQTLNDVLDEMFASNVSNNTETELTIIRKTIEQLIESTKLAEFDQKIPLSLVKEWLDRHVDNHQQQSRFMGHGVTFCGMVPMRSIPFKVVCLIGMNDECYPRRQPRLGFDLLAKDFRLGDRSRRDDDRYLFLEALFSARSTLYISYVAARIHDNAKIPPSVLVSDLCDVLNLSYQCESGDEIWSQLLTEHPLQSFSRRYFDGSDDKLFSYKQANCPSNESISSQQWFEMKLPEADETWSALSLNQLINFFRHPTRFLLTERLALRLELDDEQLYIREPFLLDDLQAWQIRQQLLDVRLQQTPVEKFQAVVDVSGVLPQGIMGEQIFDVQAAKVDQFVEDLLPEYPNDSVEPQSFDIQLYGFTLNGQLQSVSSQGLFFYRMAKTKGTDLMAAWLNHLVLNIIRPEGVAKTTSLLTEDLYYQFKPVADASTLLNDLLNHYWQGLHAPLPFFSNTSYAYAKASFNEGKASPDTAMWNAWLGNQYQLGEAGDLYHQQVFSSSVMPELFWNREQKQQPSDNSLGSNLRWNDEVFFNMVRNPLGDEFKHLALSIYEPIKAHLTEGKL